MKATNNIKLKTLNWGSKYFIICLISLITSVNIYSSFALDSTKVDLQIGFNLQSDSTKTLTAKVMRADGTPAQDVEVRFYVKRMFGLLPIESSMGNIPTDAKGETSIALPKQDFRGDTAGNIVIIAKIQNDEKYGNVETESTMKIGIPLVIDHDFFARSLWAPTGPFGLIITFCVLLVCIYFSYSLIAIIIYKIKKEGSKVVA